MNPEAPVPVTSEASKPSESKKKSNKVLWLVIALLLLVVIVLSVLLTVFFLTKDDKDSVNDSKEQVEQSQGNSDSDETASQNQEDQDVASEPETEEFAGNSIEAILPTDWTIKEYNDVSGMKPNSFVEGVTYSGLTGLDILDENKKIIFTLRGVDGIGGAGGCSELAVFSDTEETYIQTVKDETSEVGIFDSTEIIDLKNKDYSEIKFLGLTLRRVGNVIYKERDDGKQSTFNTACGVGAQFTEIPELGFNVVDSGSNYSTNVYAFSINSQVNDNVTLTKLDGVLESMVSK